MRRPIPDPAALVAALAARVDVLERDGRDLRIDVDAIGRGVAGVIGQLHGLAEDRTARTASDSATTAAAPQQDAGDQGEEGQRDWLAVTDPNIAVAWVAEADRWARDILARHGLALAPTPCWPLHPDVVADLLALVAQRADAYDSEKPTAVSEWLTRWLPAGIDRIRTSLAACLAERGHHHDGHLFDVTELDPAHAADWWATRRHIAPPVALRLPVID